MGAFLVLGGAFGVIIALGCAAVYVNDVVGRRAVEVPGNGGARQEATRSWRRRRAQGAPYSSGTIVWVRAGENASRKASVVPAGPATPTVTRAERSSWSRG